MGRKTTTEKIVLNRGTGHFHMEKPNPGGWRTNIAMGSKLMNPNLWEKEA